MEQIWTLNDGILKDEHDNVLAIVVDADKSELAAMEVAPEAMNEIEQFVNAVNSGTFRPKQAFNKLSKVLDKYRQIQSQA